MLKNIRPLLFFTGTAMLLFAALVISSLTLYVIVSSHWHGPFRDMWEIYPFLKKIITDSWSLADLWESYGYSHRLFLPKLLFITDHEWFAATNHLLISVSIICQVLICALFAFLLWHESSVSSAEKYALIAIVVCLQFSGTLLFNFMHTFDVQWFLCCCFIVAAFYHVSNISYVSLAVDRSTGHHLLLSGLLIIAACLCSFSAMAAWPIWLLLVCVGLKNLKLKVIFITTVVLFIVFYGLGARGTPVDVGSALDLFRLFYYWFVAFPFSYLSNPLIDTDFLPFGDWATVLVIPAVFVLIKFWWNLLWPGHPIVKNRLAFFLAAIATFAFGVAIITAIGRGYDPSHVRAMRYQNIVMLFWSAVILLAILESHNYTVSAKFLLRLPFVVVFVGMIWCQSLSLGQNIWLGYQVNRAHLALMMGYSHDVPMIAPTVSRAMIYVPGYNLEHERQIYEGVRKGIYSGELAKAWLLGISTDHPTTDPEACQSLSWSLLPYEGAYSHYTSFVVSGTTAGMSAAYLVDEGGKVLAIAIPGGTSSLVDALRVSLGLANPPLKGFVAPSSGSRNDKAFILVLSRFAKASLSCEIKPDLNAATN